MTQLQHRFNREAERKKESEFLFWWLVAMPVLNMRFSACGSRSAVQHRGTEF